MESTFSASSQSVSSFSPPQMQGSATGTDQPTYLSCQRSDRIIKSCQDDMSPVSTFGNDQHASTVSHRHLAAETSDKMSTRTTSAGSHPHIETLESKKNADDVVAKVADKTLVATRGEESAKDETKKFEKRKRTFPTFSVSLGREKIEADLLAMRGSKKSTMSVQNSFQEDSSSFSRDNSSNSMGSRFNLAVETWGNRSTSSDDRRKIMWKFSKTASNDNKNYDMVPTHAVYQTLVSTELEEPEKVETWKNKKKVSDAVNQTLIAKNGYEVESIQPQSTQLGFGIVPLIKENGEKKKRTTFSTFSVSLTREKIEADISAMCGSTRSRRIKKRPKSVQRRLDDLFPGLRLKFVTADDYRVRDDKT